MIKDATVSACGVYRYFLSRKWDPLKPTAPFVMLNPSTADAYEDDPTIRRICNYAKRWGFGGIQVVNLYALRVTDSKLLFQLGVDPIGPKNNRMLRRVLNTFPQVFCAWGATDIITIIDDGENTRIVVYSAEGFTRLEVVTPTKVLSPNDIVTFYKKFAPSRLDLH